MNFSTLAIIVASGRGVRFGETTPKQFLPLAGKPLLLRTLEAFEQAERIDAFAVVTLPDYFVAVESWQAQLKKLQWVVAGGGQRQDSTHAGFKAIPHCELVLVHDGARPLLSPNLINAVVAATQAKGAVIPGLAVQETLKKVAGSGHILATVERNDYATIQTPQGFRYAILQEALQEASSDEFYGTDEAMLVERMGFPVAMIPGERRNIKITTPEDWRLAEALLQES